MEDMDEQEKREPTLEPQPEPTTETAPEKPPEPAAESAAPTTPQPEPRRFRWPSRWLWLLVAAAASVPLGLAVLIGGYLYISRDLPSGPELRNYHPGLITELYSDDGTLIAEFAEERRKLMPIEKIPQRVKDAFIAVEDARFFQHQGLDYVRIAGAFWHNFKSGELKGQGASTITMQTARSFFLSRQKLWSRKLKEAILAYRIERYLNKDEILHLYLNQIYLGRGAYGVQAAAEVNFGKDVNELTLAEAAWIAGLAARPGAYSPTGNFPAAKARQRVVLNAMVEAGIITRETADQAAQEPIKISPRPSLFLDQAPYFTEYVRRYLVAQYGEAAVLKEGYKVFTTVNLDLQKAAQEAVQSGLAGPEGMDKRQGFRGPVSHLEKAEISAYLEERENELRKKWLEQAREERLIEGLTGQEAEPEPTPPDPAPLLAGELYPAVVQDVSDKNGLVAVKVGHSAGTIALADMAWAHRPDPKARSENLSLKKPSDALSKGDAALVRVKAAPAKPGEAYRFALEQAPLVQAGLIAFSSRTGEVKALVGGYDFTQNQYIRPVQSARQPGSGFKPIIYGAAIDSDAHLFTPATIVLDTAITMDDAFPVENDDQDTSWRPENYDQQFSGPRTLREGLKFSINTISIRILQEIGVGYTRGFAAKLGITSPLANDLSIALGSSPVTLEELAVAYNVYASGGYLIKPRFVTKVYDRDGNLLEWEWSGQPEPAPASAAFKEEDLMAPPAQAPNPAGEEAVPAKIAVPPSEAHQPTWENYLKTLQAGRVPRFASLSEPVHGRMVISPQTAFLMTNLLRGVVEGGTGYKARRIGKPLAGKTGTTNDFKDAWFVGYSPELTCGVWVGFDDFSKSLGAGESGAKAALPLWVDFMSAALKERPALDFPVPSGIEFANIDAVTGLLAAPCTEKTVFEAFKAGTAPAEISACSAADMRGDVIRQLDY